ncbi:MAG: hypothetical protein C0465_27200, partial [Ralstonia sp.]|nr:hypothetical protein [Ralstonia sp.]
MVTHETYSRIEWTRERVSIDGIAGNRHTSNLIELSHDEVEHRDGEWFEIATGLPVRSRVSYFSPNDVIFDQGEIYRSSLRAGGPKAATANATAERYAYLKGTSQRLAIGRVIKMSKSKKNVVDPDAIIARHGADAVRWFMLSDSPPERDLPWSDAGIEGCARFVQRLWRLFGQVGAGGAGADAEYDKALDRRLHQTVAAVAEDIEALSFNKAVARIYELVGAVEKAPLSSTRSDAIRKLAILVSPMMPHLAEEARATYGLGIGLVAESA